MKATVWGGAGEHGRSCYYIENEGLSVLLDCGGMKEAGGIYPLLDGQLVSKLDAVFLSHAHEDHAMALPLLYKLGYRGDVWTTKATAGQLPAYYAAWFQYVDSSGGQLPYNADDIKRVQFRYLEDSGTTMEDFAVAPGIRACWGASGHMVGAVWLRIELGNRTLFYSGDYCAEPGLLRLDRPFEKAAGRVKHPTGSPDLSIMDAAYGSDCDKQEILLQRIIDEVGRTIDGGGHVLLPVPLSGRGQELMMVIGRLLPSVPIAVEPEIITGFRQLLEWSDWLQAGAVERIRQWLSSGRFNLITCEKDRLRLLRHSRPAIFLTTDAMLQSDISRWYYQQLKHDPRNTILFTGHLSKDSYGATIDEAAACRIVNCRFKVHQDMGDVRRLLPRISGGRTLLAHADKAAADLLLAQLTALGWQEVYSLLPGEMLSSGEKSRNSR